MAMHVMCGVISADLDSWPAQWSRAKARDYFSSCDPGEKFYSRETFIAWSAKIMHEELHLDTEACEALEFALERTPKDQQQGLLELKAKLEK